MPYHRVPYHKPEADEDLVHALADELKSAPQNLPSNLVQGSLSGDAPDVIEEETRLGSRHVTVVWNRWAHLPIETRGRVILDAYQEAQGNDVMLQIIVAMGLTQSEALRLGIS